MAKWPKEMKEYIVECYAGTYNEGVKKRLFRWQDGGTREGDVNDFIAHLEDKFSCTMADNAWGTVHAILREHGKYAYTQHQSHATPTVNGKQEPRTESEFPSAGGGFSAEYVMEQYYADDEDTDDTIARVCRDLSDAFLRLAILLEEEIT